MGFLEAAVLLEPTSKWQLLRKWQKLLATHEENSSGKRYVDHATPRKFEESSSPRRAAFGEKGGAGHANSAHVAARRHQLNSTQLREASGPLAEGRQKVRRAELREILEVSEASDAKSRGTRDPKVCSLGKAGGS